MGLTGYGVVPVNWSRLWRKLASAVENSHIGRSSGLSALTSAVEGALYHRAGNSDRGGETRSPPVSSARYLRPTDPAAAGGWAGLRMGQIRCIVLLAGARLRVYHGAL